MIIYTSEKVMPYVYMGIHKETNEFYIGSRYTQRRKLPSHLDLYQYRTSSKRVKPIFDEFDWVIIAEFFDAAAAVACEQELIYLNWGNSLMLNGSCHYNNTKLFASTNWGDNRKREVASRKGQPGRPHTELSKQKISNANRGRKLEARSAEYCDNIRRRNSKQWIITTPDGERLVITNLAQFCKENKLHPSTMSSIAHGKYCQTEFRGWKCELPSSS